MIVVTSSCVASGSTYVQDGGGKRTPQDASFSRGGSRRRRRPRRPRRGGGRTSRTAPRRRSPPGRAAPPLGRREPGEQHRRRLLAAPHGERQRPLALVPVGALEDPGLALEPAAVRLLDVLAARGEDVEDEPAAREQQLARRSQSARSRSSSVVMCSSERNGIRTSGTRSVDRRLAHVALPQVDELLDALGSAA